MKFFLSIVILFFGTVLCSNLYAEIYEWVDENGVRRFSNVPTDIPDNSNVETTREIEIQEQDVFQRRNEEQRRRDIERRDAAFQERRLQDKRESDIRSEMRKHEQNLRHLENELKQKENELSALGRRADTYSRRTDLSALSRLTTQVATKRGEINSIKGRIARENQRHSNKMRSLGR